MRCLFGVVCVLALAVMGCSETTGTGGSGGDGGVGGSAGVGGSVVPLHTLRTDLPCLGPGSAEVNCETDDVAEDLWTFDVVGSDTYDMLIRINGVVEQKTYDDPVNQDGMWAEGGTPNDDTWNIYKIEVSSPAQTFYLNVGSSEIDVCHVADFEKIVAIDAGAELTLVADSGGDGLQTKNMDESGNPIVISTVPPFSEPFDGQFVQLDVINYAVQE